MSGGNFFSGADPLGYRRDGLEETPGRVFVFRECRQEKPTKTIGAVKSPNGENGEIGPETGRNSKISGTVPREKGAELRLLLAERAFSLGDV